MKASIFTMLFLIISQFSYGQFSFINFDFRVPVDKQQVFMEAMNTFYNSETGKKFPQSALTQHMFGYDENFTHSLTAWDEDVKNVNKMIDPSLIVGNKDFEKLMMTFSEIGWEPYQSVTGRELISSKPVEGNSFQTLWFINVDNPQETAKAFKHLIKDSEKMLQEMNVRMALGQLLSGQQKGETHYVIATFKDYETFMKASEKMYQSEGFAKWMASTNKNKQIRTDSRMVISMWNFAK